MKLLFLCIIGCFVLGPVYGQLSASDLKAVQGRDFFRKGSYSGYTGPFNSGKFLSKRLKHGKSHTNPFVSGLGAILYSYQHVISPLLSRTCPYQITCSNFAKLSIQDWGPLKGVFLAADRVLRCNRLSLENISPVKIDPRTGEILDDPLWYH